MSEYLAYIRVFSYLAIIFLSFGVLTAKSYRLVYFGNSIMAAFLMINALDYIMDSPNTPNFQIGITIVVFIWMITHLIDLISKRIK